LLGGAAQSLEDYWEESKEQFRKKYLVENSVNKVVELI
jgi:hypothetical protein